MRSSPIIGLVITLVILRITWQSWSTVREAAIDLEHIDADGPVAAGVRETHPRARRCFSETTTAQHDQ